MEKIFIEARLKDKEVNLKAVDKLLDNLPKVKTISLAATIQYLDLVPILKDYLESKSRKVIIKKGAYYDSHVLGCQSQAFDKNADILLLITDGKFHAINNAIQLQKEIYIFNLNSIEKIDQEEIKKELKKIEIKQKKFLISKTIGLLVSSKPGQSYNNVIPIKDKLEKSGKKVYLFESNNISIDEFENYPQIQIWVNTACPGIQRDNSNIVNLKDILEFI